MIKSKQKSQNKYSLYFLYLEDSGKVFYIGITKQKPSYRFKAHIRDSKKKNKKGKYKNTNRICNKIRKLQRENIKFNFEILLTSKDPLFISQKEKEYIKWSKKIGFDICNTASGGWTRWYHSEGTKKKISEGHKEKFKNGELSNAGKNNPMYGRTHSDETKKLIGEKSKGRKWTKEQRKKASKARMGKKRNLSEDYYKKMSEKLSGSKNPSAKKVESINPKTMEIVKKYGCIEDAAKDVNRSRTAISEALRGKRKTSAGLIWRYF